MTSSFSRMGCWWIGGNHCSVNALSNPQHFHVNSQKTASASDQSTVLINNSMPNLSTSAKCLAITFVRQATTPACVMDIFDLFMSFKYANITNYYCKHHPWLTQAIQQCSLIGHFEPYVLLIGGSDQHLKIIRQCWMRNQLQSPFGFRIKAISDAGGLLMQRVPQYMSMRLDEVICQLIWQNTQFDISCSFDRLTFCLRNVCADLHTREPSTEAIQAALMSLLAAGAVYFNGQGYSLLTQDKLAVVKWLENIPEALPPPDIAGDKSEIDDHCRPSSEHRVHFEDLLLEKQRSEQMAPLAEHEIVTPQLLPFTLGPQCPTLKSPVKSTSGAFAFSSSSKLLTNPTATISASLSCSPVWKQEEPVSRPSPSATMSLQRLKSCPQTTPIIPPGLPQDFPVSVMSAKKNNVSQTMTTSLISCSRDTDQLPGNGYQKGTQISAPMRWLFNRIRKMNINLHRTSGPIKSLSAVGRPSLPSVEERVTNHKPKNCSQVNADIHLTHPARHKVLPSFSGSLLQCFNYGSRGRHQASSLATSEPQNMTGISRAVQPTSMTMVNQRFPVSYNPHIELSTQWQSPITPQCHYLLSPIRKRRARVPLATWQPVIPKSPLTGTTANNPNGATAILLPCSYHSPHTSVAGSSGSSLRDPSLALLSEEYHRLTEESTTYTGSRVHKLTSRPATHDSGFIDSPSSTVLTVAPSSQPHQSSKRLAAHLPYPTLTDHLYSLEAMQTNSSLQAT